MLISPYSSSSPLVQYGKTEEKTENKSKNDSQTKDTFSHKDTVSLSEQGKNLSQSKNDIQNELNQDEIKELQNLKQRDREVRTHEQAHLAAAGGHARGGPSFTLTKGPDGNSYAVAGEVSIDMSEERSPEQTAYKMQVIRRAALAPANPSSTDRRVAAQAAVKAQQAEIDIAEDQKQDLVLPTDEKDTSNEQGEVAHPKLQGTDSSSNARLMAKTYSGQQNIQTSHSYPAA